MTASMEHLYARKLPADAYFQQLPEFLQVLLIRILHKDEDTAGLMGVPLSELYANNTAPAALSVQFAHYTFTKPDDSSGNFWDVEDLTEPRIFARNRGGVPELPEAEIRKDSPRERHWIVGLSAFGLAFGLDRLLLAILTLGGCKSTEFHRKEFFRPYLDFFYAAGLSVCFGLMVYIGIAADYTALRKSYPGGRLLYVRPAPDCPSSVMHYNAILALSVMLLIGHTFKFLLSSTRFACPYAWIPVILAAFVAYYSYNPLKCPGIWDVPPALITPADLERNLDRELEL